MLPTDHLNSAQLNLYKREHLHISHVPVLQPAMSDQSPHGRTGQVLCTGDVTCVYGRREADGIRNKNVKNVKLMTKQVSKVYDSYKPSKHHKNKLNEIEQICKENICFCN